MWPRTLNPNSLEIMFRKLLWSSNESEREREPARNRNFNRLLAYQKIEIASEGTQNTYKLSCFILFTTTQLACIDQDHNSLY